MLYGSAVDTGDGNYTVSAWPVVAGAYHMSVLVTALEPSRWALGYRQETSGVTRVSQQQAWQHLFLFTTPSAAKRSAFEEDEGLLSVRHCNTRKVLNLWNSCLLITLGV